MENPNLIDFEELRDGGVGIASNITLRDLFAGLAMNTFTFVGPLSELKGELPSMAERCYVVAGAMLKAREKS